MIDIKRIVENKDQVQEALLKRMDPQDLNLDEIINVYNLRKTKQTNFEKLRSEQNSFNDQMAKTEKGSEEFKTLITQLKDLAQKVKEAEGDLKDVDDKLIAMVEVLPNIPDEDVVAGGKENNKAVREVGEKPSFDFEVKDHLEVAQKLNLLDMERATKIGGNNFAMYTGYGALLEFALINYFIKEHVADGYKMILPPHLLTEEAGYTAGQLPKFREDVYWLQDGNMLLPTAETALANLYRDEILNENELPMKLFAYTPCYRREAGKTT